MLKIAVCIKQIPLVEDANFDPVTRTLRRDGPAVISAFDLRAVSLAIELKNRIGAETVAITMGPPQAKAALTDALAMGLDRAVHLVDRAFAGSDTLATARALAMWLSREPFDLILLGKYSLDSETGQVGPEIAELLGLAQITGVRKLELEAGGRRIRAERESDEGFEEIECDLPALLTCAERVAQPIRIKPDDAERAKSRPIESIGAAELDPDLSKFGFEGSPTSVQDVRVLENPKVQLPPDRRRRSRSRRARVDRSARLDRRVAAARARAPSDRKRESHAGARTRSVGGVRDQPGARGHARLARIALARRPAGAAPGR